MINTIRNKNIDYMKQLAIVTMVVDHLRYLLPEYQLEFIAVGRWAFIMFACVLAFNALNIFESGKVDSLKSYFKNLIIFAIISEIPYQLASQGGNLGTVNIMVTLLLGLIAIYCLNLNVKNHIKYSLFSLVMGLCLLFSNKIEFGFFGVSLIIFFYLLFKYKNTKLAYFIAPVVVLISCMSNLQYYGDLIASVGFTSVWVYSMLIGCLTGSVVALLLSLDKINLTSFRIKKIGKWAWWFYPVHLAVIYVIGYAYVW